MVPVARMVGMLHRTARAVALPVTALVVDTQRDMGPAADTPQVMDRAERPVTVAPQADLQVGMLARFDGCTTTSTMESTIEWPRALLHEATVARAEAPEFSIPQATVRPVVLREEAI